MEDLLRAHWEEGLGEIAPSELARVYDDLLVRAPRTQRLIGGR